MKRTRIGTCLVVALYLMIGSTRQAQTAVAASAIPETETTLRILPTSLNFGSVAIGTESPGQTVHLRNVGTTTVVIIGIMISGTDARDFVQINNCKTSLAAGASCQVIVRFKPIGLHQRTADLTIADNAGGSPQSVPLSGIGVAGVCSRYGGPCGSPYLPRCCRGLSCSACGNRMCCT